MQRLHTVISEIYTAQLHQDLLLDLSPFYLLIQLLHITNHFHQSESHLFNHHVTQMHKSSHSHAVNAYISKLKILVSEIKQKWLQHLDYKCETVILYGSHL